MPPLRLLAATFAVAVLCATASAQTVINAVPYTISASGKYVLGNNLTVASAAQVAITINAPNVILDLNEFFVSGPGNTLSSQVAVISVANVSNVTIRNGTVANNGYGIRFNGGTNSINHVLENLNVTRCYLAGIYLATSSPGTIIRNNTVTQTGNSTSSTSSVAIFALGGTRVDNNTVHTVTNSGGGIVAGISGVSTDIILRNTIVSSNLGVFGGKYRDNTTLNCTTPFSSGIDAGGNE